ncbi:DUF1963 domain-containing protein [Chitinophaga japonensis]|nr:DUF1963 domain-containing protein [Chitinophaga japonensis]
MSNNTLPAFSIPENGQPIWRIDGFDFEWLPATHWSISEGDGRLYVGLQGRITGYDDKKHGHIVNDYQHGEVYLNFALGGVYRNGVPTGVFHLEADKEPTYACTLWKGGFHYSLESYGTLTLQDGWVGFEGYLQGIVNNQPYRVQVARSLPVAALNWQHYRFTSLEEAFQAPAGQVQHLRLTDPGIETFPEQLYACTALKTLHIHFTGKNSHSLAAIPARINSFTELKELSLTGISRVTAIPPEIAQLTSLENLVINGSQATAIPPELLQLPRLKYCYLVGNQLESLPAAFSPALATLALQQNRLSTLPETIGNLPALTHLDIRRNPLQQLPANIRHIKKLNLELEKKQQLLDYAYKGADGRGAITWDDRLFLAGKDPELLSLLDQAITGAGFSAYRQGLLHLALKAVALGTTEPDTYATKGNTRFGGLPDLPPGMGYPAFTTYHGDTKGMQFIAQLNLASLAAYQEYLPRTGILYFFIEDQESFNCRVFYYDGDPAQLQFAGDLPIDEEFIYDDNGIYAPYLARAAKFPSLPSFYHDQHFYTGDAQHLAAFEEEVDYEEKEQFLQRLKPGGYTHGINDYVFTQHESPQIQAADKLGGKPEEWMVLLSVDSDAKTGFQFWDAGTIFFVIHKSDLARKDFSQVYYGLESS